MVFLHQRRHKYVTGCKCQIQGLTQNRAPPLRTNGPRLEGFPSFAQFIASDGDAAIYRKYSHLSARNLLYLQSELHALEKRLQILDREDAKDLDNTEAQKAARDWSHFSDRNNERACQHRELQIEIRVKIKEYRMCLDLRS